MTGHPMKMTFDIHASYTYTTSPTRDPEKTAEDSTRPPLVAHKERQQKGDRRHIRLAHRVR